MTSETKEKEDTRKNISSKQNHEKRSLLNYLLVSLAVLLSSILIAILASKYEPVAFYTHQPLKFQGPLAANNKLQNAELLLKDQQVIGPESLIVEGDVIYAAVEDGRILKVVNGKIVKEVILVKDKECQTSGDRLKNPHKCGRPLGMRRLNKDLIVFADAYLGVVTVDVEKGEVKIILPGDTIVDGKPLRFADDLDILDENTVIISDASTKWYHNLVVYDFIEHNPNGRVIQVDLKTGEAKVLLDKLVFPNGIQLFPDKQSVLISETWEYRVTRLYIAGPKKGQHEVFVNLPGAPDNIRLNPRGNFWVAIACTRQQGKFFIWDFLAPYPLIRTLIMQLVPESYIGDFHLWLLQKYGLIVEVDQNGNFVSSLHDPTGEVREVSQIEEDEKYLYVASYHMPFIAKVKK
uniref:Strictosidine synthase conserved region domain-containing protein n=1 Tax=Acrobeloides nanus TaxID=290746 RepID=A0A914EA74_9BILA